MKAIDFSEAATLLSEGKIGIIPTDTVYGLVARAHDGEAVDRVSEMKARPFDKPFIILIGEVSDLKQFHIDPDKETRDILSKYWPGKVSIILPCEWPDFDYLHRGKEKLAFRLPDNQPLRDLIKKTGPIIAPSANPGGLPTAKTVEEAYGYFTDTVDFYVDGGHLPGEPSTLIKIIEGQVEVLRQGAVKI